MKHIEISVDLDKFNSVKRDREIAEEVLQMRNATKSLSEQGKNIDALENTVGAMTVLKGFSSYDSVEFKVLLASLLFDLTEVYFDLKDYKQSEKELQILFRVLENIIKQDPDRFGKYHVMALELSTRILRSRKKALDMLAKQQLAAGALYEKVNAGMVSATDKLVDALRNIGDLLAASGDYKASLKFYSEAIKFSKRKNGRVTAREIRLTVDMVKIMMRLRSMRPRALRLLDAVLPKAVAMKEEELIADIHSLEEVINSKQEQDPAWKLFLRKLQSPFSKKSKSSAEDEAE